MWQKKVKPFVDAGELTVVGVVQEQHPDRASLYKQWKQLDWPIFVDSLNLLDLAVVPVPMALDELGIVRGLSLRPGDLQAFMQEPPAVGGSQSESKRKPEQDSKRLLAAVERNPSVAAWRDLGDYRFLFGGEAGLGDAVNAYQQAVVLNAADGRSHFRLGVALRRRSESAGRRPGDAQAAVNHWGLALATDPNQYIWRRRIQQYGPRLDKPYNFYFWVDKARSAIRARGESPVALRVEPNGSELAAPATAGESAPPINAVPFDSHGKVSRDTRRLIRLETMVTPTPVRPGRRVRVQLALSVDGKARPYWNNESEDLRVSVSALAGAAVVAGEFAHANPQHPETQENRTLEFELQVDKSFQGSEINVPGFALYYVCERGGGQCRFLRQDFELQIKVDAKAPIILR